MHVQKYEGKKDKSEFQGWCVKVGLMGGVQCEGREEKGKKVRADLERPVCLAKS